MSLDERNSFEVFEVAEQERKAKRESSRLSSRIKRILEKYGLHIGLGSIAFILALLAVLG